MMGQSVDQQDGVGVIEALCAVVIIAIAITGSISLYLSTMRHLATARAYSGVSSDVEAIVETLRNETYAELLTRFNKTYTSIGNGETISITPTTHETKADYTVTLKAIKTQPEGVPEAVQVDVVANERGTQAGTLSFNFSTMIAQTE